MKSIKIYIIKGMCMIVVLLGFLNCNRQKEIKTLKLAHGLDTQHSVHFAMEYMGERLNEYSGGSLTIEIYPNAQLGSEREYLELLQIGALDIAKTSAAVVENFAPSIKILGIPYLFVNDEHEREVLNGRIGKKLLASTSKYYFRGLCFYDAGNRSFYSIDKPIKEPADLEGMKIRVMNSNTAIQFIRTLGGSATPISWGELYTALQQGIVDGAENNPPSFYLSKHYEVCKYYTLDEHTAVPDILFISEHTWKKLTEEQRSWIQKAAAESAEYQRGLWEKSEREALEAVIEAGVEVFRPDKSLFADKVSNMYEDLLDTEELIGLYKEIQDAK